MLRGYSSYSSGRPVNWIQGTVVAGDRAQVPGLMAADLDAFITIGGFIDATEEAMVQSILDAAIEIVCGYTGYEPTQRQMRVKFDVHPQQFRFYDGVRQVGGHTSPWIKLPRYPVISIDSVFATEAETTILLTEADYEIDLDSNPARVSLISFSAGQINIDITVGPTGSILPRFKQAVLNVAAYMYEHRGCKYDDSILKASGAASICRPLRVAIGAV